jgi:hypothetical protein
MEAEGPAWAHKNHGNIVTYESPCECWWEQLSPQQLRNDEGLWSMFCEVGIADEKDIGTLDVFQATLQFCIHKKRKSLL